MATARPSRSRSNQASIARSIGTIKPRLDRVELMRGYGRRRSFRPVPGRRRRHDHDDEAKARRSLAPEIAARQLVFAPDRAWLGGRPPLDLGNADWIVAHHDISLASQAIRRDP